MFYIENFTVPGFAVNGVNNVNTTTLERRFNLPSSTVGMISSAYDFAAGILVLPITYLGARSHHPRMLAIAALFMSIGSFLMSLPHFTSGPYDTAGSATAGQCDSYGENIFTSFTQTVLSYCCIYGEKL